MDFSTCCAFQKGHWHASKRKQDREDLGRSGKGEGVKKRNTLQAEGVKKRNTLQAEDIKCTMLATKRSLKMHQHRHDHTGKTESDTQRAAGDTAKSNNDVQVMILQDETEVQTLGGIEPCRERRGWGPTSSS